MEKDSSLCTYVSKAPVSRLLPMTQVKSSSPLFLTTGNECFSLFAQRALRPALWSLGHIYMARPRGPLVSAHRAACGWLGVWIPAHSPREESESSPQMVAAWD